PTVPNLPLMQTTAEPVTVQPTTTVLGGVSPETIEDYLVQGDEETDAHFDLRATLAEAIMATGGMEPSEAVMVARLLQDKYELGVVYPEAIETILKATLTKL